MPILSISGITSHPVWVCGLKPRALHLATFDCRSHPVWVCGLKQDRGKTNASDVVTPCMGVWIETYAYAPRYLDFKSHPVWVCGLKQSRG